MNLINLWILGRQSIVSGEARKRVLLSGYFILIFSIIGTSWIVMEYYLEPKTLKLIFLLSFTVFNALSFFLIRNGWFYTGTLLVLGRANLGIAIIAFDYLHTYMDIYLIFAGIAALAIFGYEKRWIGIGGAIISFLLYFIITIDPSTILIEGTHFDRQVSFTITFLSLFAITYFFNYLTYQYDLLIQSQNEKLTKTNEELDRFVYTASHDLKAPLNSVTGLVSIIKLTDDPVEIKSMVKLIEKSVDSLKHFINEITDYARNSRTEIVYETIQLHALAEEVYATLQFHEKAKLITWSNDIDKDLNIQTDQYRLRILLTNLLANGIKYADTSKPNPLLTIKGRVKNNSLILSIEDNGIGIAADKLPKLFQMFYRATESESGSGLGLYIAKEAVEKLNGQIKVKSISRKGTTFLVSLPLPT
jgi:signal transduction histidine kinase